MPEYAGLAADKIFLFHCFDETVCIIAKKYYLT
jgi:hypothetical protein